MPVRRRRDSAADAWWIDFRDSTGKRYLLTRRATSRRAAQAVERAERSAAEVGVRARKGGGVTVGEAFARYWQEHGRFLASKGSERGYMNRWADSLGDTMPIMSVTAERVARSVVSWRTSSGGQLDKYRQPREREYVTDSTINHRLRFLQRVWGRAEEMWGWTLPRIPWRRLRLPEPSELPDRSLGRAMSRALLRSMNPRSRPLVMMALVTGLRRGALLRLEAKDLDWHAGIVRAISKGRAGGKLTPVPMTRAVRWVLRRSGFDGMGSDCGDGAPAPMADVWRPVLRIGRVFAVTPALLRKDWNAARRAIGRPDLRLHDLRHTFAQRLEDAGAGDLISDALHHSDPRLRRRYSKVRIERLREKLDHLNPRRRA